jgi:hypothetical protein
LYARRISAAEIKNCVPAYKCTKGACLYWP